MANRIALAILARRGRDQEPIALLLDNDAPMIAAMLGVLKAGKIYVPLDPSLPTARLAHILRDSQAALLLTDRSHQQLAADVGQPQHASIDIERLAAHDSAQDNLRLPISPDALTWILYTSGSTGHPKGVVQTHRNVLHYVRNYTNGLRLSADDRLSLLFSFGVNGAAHEMFSALLNGACLYPLNIKAEGITQLASWLVEHEVTTYCSVPTVFRHFCEVLTGAERFPRLRLIKLIGEPVLKRDVELYRNHFGADCILVNRFGSTETGTVRWYFIDQKTVVDGDLVPVGHAADGNGIVILNETGVEAALGEAGEIAVRSPYLSPGYWRKPELTEKAFTVDPRGGKARLYRTGDLGRMLTDGSLMHLGRKDFQVKILGHRVEPAEIEAILSSLPATKEAVVMAREDPHGELRLVAYLVTNGHTPPTAMNLRQFLASRVPSHMVPSAFVLLGGFPLAQNGKVDRRALPQPDWGRPELETAFVAPRTPVENTLAKIWADVLGIEQVGIKDNFFELGGHSLLGMRVCGQVEKTFGKRLPPATLFQAPTVEQLAGILGQEESPGPSSSLVALQPNGSKPPFFWVHGETSNAFLPCYLGPDQPVYGLVQQSRDGTRALYTRVEDIATYYLKGLRSVQPHGPYFLGGYCIGGTLAFEMAQQLRRQGQEVALLVLLDPPPAGSGRSSRSLAARFSSSLPDVLLCGDWFSRQFRHLARRRSQERLSYVWDGVRSRTRRQLTKITDRTKTLACHVYLAIGTDYPIHPSLRVRYINAVHSRAKRDYVPQVYQGRLVVLNTEGSADSERGWRSLAARGVEIHEVPGQHAEIVFKKSTIEGLAKQLKACLDRAQAAAVEPQADAATADSHTCY